MKNVWGGREGGRIHCKTSMLFVCCRLNNDNNHFVIVSPSKLFGGQVVVVVFDVEVIILCILFCTFFSSTSPHSRHIYIASLYHMYYVCNPYPSLTFKLHLLSLTLDPDGVFCFLPSMPV